jgi:hypothetical protein
VFGTRLAVLSFPTKDDTAYGSPRSRDDIVGAATS